jgi:hypothetical protein
MTAAMIVKAAVLCAKSTRKRHSTMARVHGAAVSGGSCMKRGCVGGMEKATSAAANAH